MVFSLAVLGGCLPRVGLASPATTKTIEPTADSHYRKTCISADCHPIGPGGRIPRHQPFLEGQCSLCHVDHSSTGTALLKPGGNSLCLQCHTGLEMGTDPTQVKHPPDTNLCTDCHNPHESSVRNLLREEVQLGECALCHKPFLSEAAKLPYRHLFFDPRTECGTCHYAHQRSPEKYIRENVAESCLTCHDLSIRVEGRGLENIAERLRTYPVVHQALEKASCPTCHTPHGSVQPTLLKTGYPAGNYDAYQQDQYALCWTCHEAAIIENPKGTKVTEFRHGDENLHWFHVAKLKRGRTCHLCHSAHASQQPHLMKQKVLFRKWYGTLTWTPSAAGGSCQTPCHDQRDYQR